MKLARHIHVLHQQDPWKQTAKSLQLVWRRLYYRQLLKKYMLTLQA